MSMSSSRAQAALLPRAEVDPFAEVVLPKQVQVVEVVACQVKKTPNREHAAPGRKMVRGSSGEGGKSTQGSARTVMSRAAAASSKAASNRLLPGGFERQDFLHGERAELLDAARVRAAQKVK